MNLRVGDIVHIAELDVNPVPKGKYCVVVCLGPNKYLTINTKDRSFYDSIPLNVRPGRKFPKHNGFVACHKIFLGAGLQVEHTGCRLADYELRALKVKILKSEYLAAVEIAEIVSAIESVL